ncbi:Txe/YoeB family addiction module toxin [Pedobacter sp. JCM 36344]|uniref:Txe/YoeB family addiction module toxin n=1 Tax=Pedobacter sp. JCM 36344 TaxID=3374280 RepID=UPI00397E22E8
MYTVIFSQKAQQDLKSLKKSEPQAYKKARLLIEELAEHPKTGRGKPQLKKYDLEGLYARKITDKHRLVYSINDEIITVDILSARGHYNDK